MRRRFLDIQRKGFPYLVATDETSVDSVILGYAYASTFRGREGFDNTVEASIYVQNGITGKGLGKMLFSELLSRCTSLGLRQIVSVISTGAETTESSIELHKRFGFKHVGTLTGVGYKFNSWVDCLLYQLTLGDGTTSRPTFELGR